MFILEFLKRLITMLGFKKKAPRLEGKAAVLPDITASHTSSRTPISRQGFKRELRRRISLYPRLNAARGKGEPRKPEGKDAIQREMSKEFRIADHFGGYFSDTTEARTKRHVRMIAHLNRIHNTINPTTMRPTAPKKIRRALRRHTTA